MVCATTLPCKILITTSFMLTSILSSKKLPFTLVIILSICPNFVKKIIFQRTKLAKNYETGWEVDKIIKRVQFLANPVDQVMTVSWALVYNEAHTRITNYIQLPFPAIVATHKGKTAELAQAAILVSK